jgi:Polysulfide reductase
VTGTTTPTGAGGGGRGERRMVPPAEPRSYYGRPVLKEPVWSPEVPFYFFAGGLAGASAVLGLGADIAGNRPLARRAWIASFVGMAASPPLLIKDLGRPERFLNMLRVFKPTSPMSMGSWILSAFGASVPLVLAHELTGAFPRLDRLGRLGAGLFGPPLATYTAVLVADTAIPVWHEARRELPFVFAGSAGASAGAAAAVLTPARFAGPARRLAIAGAVLETAATQVMEHRLGELAEPYRSGRAGTLAKAAKTLTTGGAALMAWRGRRRPAAVAAGSMLLAGAVCERWTVFRAGFQSAADPKYTVGPQRERLRARRGEPAPSGR